MADFRGFSFNRGTRAGNVVRVGDEMARHTPANERADPLKPSVSLLSKIGSIAVHIEEFLSPGGHAFDKVAIEQLLQDPEVREWLQAMKVYLPAKR